MIGKIPLLFLAIDLAPLDHPRLATFPPPEPGHPGRVISFRLVIDVVDSKCGESKVRSSVVEGIAINMIDDHTGRRFSHQQMGEYDAVFVYPRRRSGKWRVPTTEVVGFKYASNFFAVIHL